MPYATEYRPKLVLVEPPEALPVALPEAFEELRLDEISDEALVKRKIEAATAEIDGRDGWLGRALITQEWDLILPGFPTESRLFSWDYLWMTYFRRGESEITIPLPPLQEIVEISYTDPVGQTQQFSDYRVLSGEPARLLPDYGTSWPATREDPDAVRIRFKAGYGGYPEAVPAPIREYILAQVATGYDIRGRTVIGSITSEVPHIRHMLESYRVMGALE